MSVAQAMLTERELAGLLSVSERTLRSWRKRRVGPAFVRVGGLLRYERETVAAWLLKRTQGTSEGTKGPREQGTKGPGQEWLRDLLRPVVSELLAEAKQRS